MVYKHIWIILHMVLSSVNKNIWPGSVVLLNWPRCCQEWLCNQAILGCLPNSQPLSRQENLMGSKMYPKLGDTTVISQPSVSCLLKEPIFMERPFCGTYRHKLTLLIAAPSNSLPYHSYRLSIEARLLLRQLPWGYPTKNIYNIQGN